jgi:hypothetical protein
MPSRFALRQRKIIGGCFAVDLMRNGRVVGATQEVSEIDSSATSAPTRGRPFAAALCKDAMRASMSAK